MKEQIYILENTESFNLKHIFECGQCFRWNLENDNSYTGIVLNSILNLKKEQNSIVIKGMCNKNIIDVCKDYFNLGVDYKTIKMQLSKIDTNLKTSIQYGNGIRILHQDLWETIISFIISANNNIPRIKGIIEKISKEYGKEIVWNNKIYYLFPTPQELSKASIQDLKNLGLGFRDKRIYDTTKLWLNNKIDFEKILHSTDTNIIREELLKLPGVGPKVADCIMLFSLNKYNVFPIDVWVNRVMTELYFKEDLKKPNNKEILKFANKKFGDKAGIAQQYLFYWRKNQK